MKKTSVIIASDPPYNRIDKLTIQKQQKKPMNVRYIYDASGFLKGLDIDGEELTTSEIAQIVNARYLDRIGLINLINTINLIKTIDTIDTIDTINTIQKVGLPNSVLSNKVESDSTQVVWGTEGTLLDIEGEGIFDLALFYVTDNIMNTTDIDYTKNYLKFVVDGSDFIDETIENLWSIYAGELANSFRDVNFTFYNKNASPTFDKIRFCWKFPLYFTTSLQIKWRSTQAGSGFDPTTVIAYRLFYRLL